MPARNKDRIKGLLTEVSLSQVVCALLIGEGCKEIMRMLQSGELQPEQWIESTVPGERFTLLSAAIERSWTELAIYLIEKGADVNRRSGGVTPLVLATEVQNYDIIDKLIAAGADVNAFAGGETALMIAAREFDLNLVRRLLRAGANARILTRRKQTAVYSAVFPAVFPNREEGGAEIIQELVAAGSPMVGDDLHFPIYRRWLATTKLLIGCGCPTNALFGHKVLHGPNRGETPLTAIVRINTVDIIERGFNRPSTLGRRLEIAKLLLAHGADPNLPNNNGWTPLMLAVTERESALAQLLSDAGADPFFVPKGSKAESPAAIAAKRNAGEFSLLFEKHRDQSRD